MKKAIALTLLMISITASASCPPHAPYRCYTGMNGKMVCGCGI